MIDPALLGLYRVTAGYGGAPVVVDVDLTVTGADFVGIVGPSGSGKTTLLKVVLDTHRPDSGTIKRRAGLTVGYVPQVGSVDWSFPVTVAEAVLMARPTTRRLPWASATERHDVATTLDRLGIGDLGSRHLRDLSGGQQQRVFLARALVRRPDLLVLDEPTSGVDVATRHEILHLLGELNEAGLAVLLTTHDLNGIAAHLPRLVCLNGEVIATGSPNEVLTPEVLEKTYGAPMDVLEHGGMPVVVDRFGVTRSGRSA